MQSKFFVRISGSKLGVSAAAAACKASHTQLQSPTANGSRCSKIEMPTVSLNLNLQRRDRRMWRRWQVSLLVSAFPIVNALIATRRDDTMNVRVWYVVGGPCSRCFPAAGTPHAWCGMGSPSRRPCSYSTTARLRSSSRRRIEVIYFSNVCSVGGAVGGAVCCASGLFSA